LATVPTKTSGNVSLQLFAAVEAPTKVGGERRPFFFAR
jgi:hypothetical protein